MCAIRHLPVVLALQILGGTTISAAQPLGTLPHGPYVCALPGDAGGDAWKPLPEMGFTIGNASTYTTATGSGIYLMAGDTVAFTRGPMKGMRFSRAATATLILLGNDGMPGRIRCVRGGGSAAP